VSAIVAESKAGSGRGKKTRLECVRRDMKELRLLVDDEQTRSLGGVNFEKTSEPHKHGKRTFNDDD